jgi:hypothetical protein
LNYGAEPAAAPGSSRKREAAVALAPTLPTSHGSSPLGPSQVSAFDNVLAPTLLADLRYAFRKESLFWEV